MPAGRGSASAAASTSAPTGRLTANSHGQLDTTRIAAPIVGPAAPDSATVIAFQPITAPSSRCG